MSFFTLCKTAAQHTFANDTADYFSQANIKQISHEHIDGWELCCFSDLAGHGPLRHTSASGDFIIQFGSLIYQKRSGQAALEQLLTTFHPDTFDWSKTLGSFTLLLYKSGVFYLINDGLGTSKTYTNTQTDTYSNSFLACCKHTAITELNAPACYDYVVNGALFGTDTLVVGINSLPSNAIVAIQQTTSQVLQKPSPIVQQDFVANLSLDEAAKLHCQQLATVFEPLAQCYGDHLRVSFSGGFDSRLMLAMLLEQGIKPALFVYGNNNDADVMIATQVAKAEGLELVHVNKGTTPLPELDHFATLSRRNLIAFDGWKVEYGVLDHGQDLQDRLSRCAAGAVPLNGSLGEIYRNFHYIPDGASSTEAVISTFYSQYHQRTFSDDFHESEYRARLSDNMRTALNTSSNRLQRYQVEELYPLFRGRFWAGRDSQLNQRFGDMFFPYMEPSAISNTAKVALKHKDLGYLQGAMIAQTHPRLAGYPSDYGFTFNEPRPHVYRVKTWLSTQRPAWLRKRSFQLTHRTPVTPDGILSDRYLQQIIDTTFPRVGRLFTLTPVYSSKQYGLIATLEFLATELDIQVPQR